MVGKGRIEIARGIRRHLQHHVVPDVQAGWSQSLGMGNDKQREELSSGGTWSLRSVPSRPRRPLRTPRSFREELIQIGGSGGDGGGGRDATFFLFFSFAT